MKDQMMIINLIGLTETKTIEMIVMTVKMTEVTTKETTESKETIVDQETTVDQETIVDQENLEKKRRIIHLIQIQTLESSI